MNPLQILQTINAKFPGAVIAGGFVRDQLLLRDAKDIDVYIHAPGDNGEAEAALREMFDVKAEYGFGRVAEMLGSSGDTSDNDFRERLTAVFKLYRPAEPNVDVLFFNEPIAPDASNVLASFDVELCKVALLPNGSVVCAPGFIKDCTDGTLTITRASEHAERVVSYFPGRTVVGPRYVAPGDDLVF